MEALHTVSLNAKRDIGWWRIISIASMKDARFMSTPFSHLRRSVEWVGEDGFQKRIDTRKAKPRRRLRLSFDGQKMSSGL